MTKELKISFRVPPPYSKRVSEGAKRLGMSKHQYARLLLVRQIENSEVLQVLDILEDINRRLKVHSI